ncbi:MAG: PRTRC system protein C [Acidobacteriota bacterium]|nr:PRTRC system protein C [Acidobacteriota bacterium]
MKVTTSVREFSYMGLKLPYINPSLSPEEVKSAYATQYPELATAAINGPDALGDKLKYDFVRAVGAKG